MNIKIRPLYDRVVVLRLDADRTSAGGIIIPDNATEKPMQGKVVAIGNGKLLDNGDLRALTVKIGDKIVFGKYSGTEVKVGADEFVIMREDDIMGIIED